MRSVEACALLASLALIVFASFANAQQPGSVEYNTVFLPAHGVGDTIPASSFSRWGALASGDGKVIGFAVGTKGKAEAEDLALDDCSANGGKNCKVVTAFADGCLAVAAKPGRANWASDDVGRNVLESVKSRAMKKCGADCRIVRQGCAEPVR